MFGDEDNHWNLLPQDYTECCMTGEDIDGFHDTFDDTFDTAPQTSCTRNPSSIDTNYLSSQLMVPQFSTQTSPASSTRLYHQTTDDTDEMFITTPLAHATPTPTKRQTCLSIWCLIVCPEKQGPVCEKWRETLKEQT